MRCNSRTLLFTLLLLVVSPHSSSLRAADKPWGTDPEKALQAAAQTGRPVFMQFSASWCAICKRLEKNTLANPEVANRISRSYVPVRVDADRHGDLAKDLDIKGLPTILIVSPNLEILHRISGFQTVDAMLAELDTAEQAAARTRPSAAPRERRLATESTDDQPPARRVPAQTASRSRTEEDIEDAPARASTVSRSKATPKSKPAARPARNVEELPDDFLQMVEEEQQRSTTDDESSVQDFEPETPARPKPRSPAAQPKSPARKPAFEGASLVSAVDDRVIEPGSSRFQTTFRGQTLHFTSERQRRAFEDDPERYWPALDGCCPLTLLRTDRREPGRLEHAAVFRSQVWLFASEEDMQEFIGSPAAVIEDVRELGVEN